MKNFLSSNFLLALLPVAAALLVALIGGVEYQPFPDSRDYLTLAPLLMDGFEQASDVPAGWRTPGYPALLWCAQASGIYAYLTVNLISLYLVTLILLNAAGGWKINRTAFVVMMTFSAGILTLSVSALSEMPFILFLVLNLELLRHRAFGLSAAMLAVAVIIRPAAMFLWMVEAGYIWIVYRPKLLRMVLFMLMANFFVLVWSVRNFAIFDHFAFTSHSGRYALLYKAGAAISRESGKSFESVALELRGEIESEVREEGGDVNNQFELDRKSAEKALEFALTHPGRLAVALAADLPNFWMPDIGALLERLRFSSGNKGTLSVLRTDGATAAIKHYLHGSDAWITTVIAIYVVFYCIVLILIFMGWWKMMRLRQWRAVWALSLLTGYFYLLPAGNLDWRFRMTVWPFLLLCAAYSLTAVRRRDNGRQCAEPSGNQLAD